MPPRRPIPSRWPPLAAAAALALIAAPAAAMPLIGTGDGIGTDNPDLLPDFLRPAHGTCAGCGPVVLAALPAGYQPQPVSQPVAAPPAAEPPPVPAATAQAVYHPNNAVIEDRLLPGAPLQPYTFAADAVPPEPYHPFLGIDWSLGLRGTLISDGAGKRFAAGVLPAVTMRHDGVRATLRLDASAELERPLDVDEELRVVAGEIAVEAGYALGPGTDLSGGAALALEQDEPEDGEPQPLVATGTADIALAARFGRLNAELSADAVREAALTGGAPGDDFAGAGAGLRLGYAVTPILEAFAAAETDRLAFDAADPALGARRDSWTHVLRAGVVANWRDALILEASLGHGTRRFDAAALAGYDTLLYAASLAWSPGGPLDLSAGFETTLPSTGADAPGVAAVEHRLDGEIAYRVNARLSVAANASARWARTVGGETVETGYGAGVGASFVVNDHMLVSADYDFSRTETPADLPEDSHRITLGVTFSR